MDGREYDHLVMIGITFVNNLSLIVSSVGKFFSS